MKYLTKLAGGILLYFAAASTMNAQLPWENGKLEVSAEGRYLKHQNGQPFFWLGDTGWLMPQRLNREEVAFYLDNCSRAGFNVVQVQTLNGVPSMNVYGQYSMTDGFDFSHIDKEGVYGYWNHMDYIVRTAESKGIYIGMVCIWGGLVRSGQMNVEEAKAYGTFLAERYKDSPNIVWIIGGDTRGDVKTEVWETLARTIRSIDKNHLMTFHPFGRTMSATWFNDANWLDFNMFQSGHRRYGQTKGDGDNLSDSNVAEDNWRYVEASLSQRPMKPVLTPCLASSRLAPTVRPTRGGLGSMTPRGTCYATVVGLSSLTLVSFKPSMQASWVWAPSTLGHNLTTIWPLQTHQ